MRAALQALIFLACHFGKENGAQNMYHFTFYAPPQRTGARRLLLPVRTEILRQTKPGIDQERIDTMPPTRFRLPVSAIFFGVLGLITLAVGIFAMAGLLHKVHPLLNADGGLALVVSGIALILSGAFPLGLAMLAAVQSSAD